MPNYPYLGRSGKRGFWRYRRSIPPHLRARFGKREFLFNFGATNLEEVLPFYHAIAADTERDISFEQAEWDWREGEKAAAADGGDTIINHLISGDASSDPSHLCDAQHDLAASCERHYRWCKDAELAFRHTTTKQATADPDAFWRGEIIPLPMSQAEFYALPQFSHLAGTGDGYKYLLAMAYAKRLEDGATALRARLATQDVEAVAAYFGSCPTCAKQYGMAHIQAQLRVVHDFLTTDAAFVPSPAQAPAVPVSTASSASQPQIGPPLSEAVQQWIRSGSQGSSAWSAERRALCQRVMGDFLELCGERGVGDYRKSDGRKFVQLLRRLPANLEKKRASLGLEGKSLRAIADIAEQKGLAPQDDSNTNKKIGIVHQCFNWITKQFDECEASPVHGMKVLTRRSAKDERDPFTLEQLTAIFSAPVYMGCLSERHWNQHGQLILRESAKFWVPLIALFTGMRSGEICQLTTKHVQVHEGVHFFALTNELRLTNPASVRSVPIHATLIKCGLPEFVASRQGRLFPDLTQHISGRWSDAFGKHFARFLQSCGGQSDSTNFHSFRHSFVAAADACGIEFATRERILGHSLQGQGGRYGSSYKQEQADMQLMLTRNRQLQLLCYPRLKLDHLHR
jgi:integrase